jgi:hypothetical protein
MTKGLPGSSLTASRKAKTFSKPSVKPQANRLGSNSIADLYVIVNLPGSICCVLKHMKNLPEIKNLGIANPHQ